MMTPAPTPLVATTTTSSNIGDVENGPMAKAGQQLITLYEEFVQGGGTGTFNSSLSSVLEISGTNVGVDIQSTPGAFPNLVTELTSLGMQIQSSSASYDTVVGFLPIAQLPTAAQLPQTLSISPITVRRLRL
jgi:hypothetical protein